MPPKKPKDTKNILCVGEQTSVNAVNTSAGTVKAPVSINSLNIDCLQNIIKYLPIKDRVAAERVSKLWNSASKSSWGNFKLLNFEQELWGTKKEFFTRSFEDRLTMLESVLSRCGKFLTSLNLENFCLYDEQDKSSNKLVFNSVKKSCTNLKSLYMKDEILIDKSSIPTLKVIIKNLQHLECKINDEVTDQDLKRLFSSCKELNHLKVTAGKSISVDFLYCLSYKKIKKLELIEFKSGNSMYYAIQKFENLEKLVIEDLSDDFNVSESNFEWPKTLKLLCLYDCGLYNLSFISKMTSLTWLQLYDVFITDSVLFKIGKNCSELQILELYANEESTAVTDRGIQALSALSKLEDLRLSWLEITGKSFKHFSTLKKFSVKYCDNIDGKSLCEVLLTCKQLEELTINPDYGDDEGGCKSRVIDFFTIAKKFLKQRRLFINNKPLKVVLHAIGFVRVTSTILADSKKVKLFFEVYKYDRWGDDSKSRKILGTNDFCLFINKFNRNSFFS